MQRIYDEAWSQADQDRYFAHLDRTQDRNSSKRSWKIFISLFAGFLFCLWVETAKPIQLFTAIVVIGYVLICAAAIYFTLPRNPRK